MLLNAVLVHGVGGLDPEPERWSNVLEDPDPVALANREAQRIEGAHGSLRGLLAEPLGSVDVAPTVFREVVRRLGDVSADEGPGAALETVLRRTEDRAVGSPQADTPVRSPA